jgi:fibrillarin-like pre-rRNA processing protein
MKEIFPGVFLIEDRLATLNRIKGFDPFNDGLIEKEKKEFRFWNPTRSKLAAAIMKKIKTVPINSGTKLIYLGAAHGMTVSHISDIIGEEGMIYAIEFSDKPFNELLPIASKLKNIAPILADARKPEEYQWIEKVDIVYCDIAQPDQTEIAIRNCKEFLKKNGYLMLAIKTQSIDVTKSTKQVTDAEINKLKDARFEIIDWKMLEPFEDKHSFVIGKF